MLLKKLLLFLIIAQPLHSLAEDNYWWAPSKLISVATARVVFRSWNNFRTKKTQLEKKHDQTCAPISQEWDNKAKPVCHADPGCDVYIQDELKESYGLADDNRSLSPKVFSVFHPWQNYSNKKDELIKKHDQICAQITKDWENKKQQVDQAENQYKAHLDEIRQKNKSEKNNQTLSSNLFPLYVTLDYIDRREDKNEVESIIKRYDTSKITFADIKELKPQFTEELFRETGVIQFSRKKPFVVNGDERRLEFLVQQGYTEHGVDNPGHSYLAIVPMDGYSRDKQLLPMPANNGVLSDEEYKKLNFAIWWGLREIDVPIQPVNLESTGAPEKALSKEEFFQQHEISFPDISKPQFPLLDTSSLKVLRSEKIICGIGAPASFASGCYALFKK